MVYITGANQLNKERSLISYRSSSFACLSESELALLGSYGTFIEVQEGIYFE
jgi:hypothetical protein